MHPLAHLLGALSATVSTYLRVHGGGRAYRYMERLEERNEQLQAEKERLLYDVQRRGRPLDDDDERSAIRRGLQGGEAITRAHAPSEQDSPPPSLPPGAPSSSAGESTLGCDLSMIKVPPLTMVKVPPSAAPQPGSCASSGRAWRLWAARHSLSEDPATGTPATASGAQVSCLQSRRFCCL